MSDTHFLLALCAFVLSPTLFCIPVLIREYRADRRDFINHSQNNG